MGADPDVNAASDGEDDAGGCGVGDLIVIGHLQYSIWLCKRGDHASAQTHALRALATYDGALQQDELK